MDQSSTYVTTPHSSTATSSSDNISKARDATMDLPKVTSADEDKSSQPNSVVSSSDNANAQGRDRWELELNEYPWAPAGVPQDQRWHHDPDWQDTKRQLLEIMRCRELRPIIKTRYGPDGQPYQVQLRVAEAWPDIVQYPDPTAEDVNELCFVERAHAIVHGLTHARLVEKARQYEQYHGHPAIVDGPGGTKITLVGPNYDGTVPTTSTSGSSSTGPQQQMQPSLNRNQRRAAKARSQKRAD